MLVTLLLACAHTPGARPHDMSTAEHEASAESQEAAAKAEASQYDPNSRVSTLQCEPLAPGHGRICWTSVTNPTEEHRRAAERHHAAAEAHRAASAALRDAEASACAGLAQADQEMSPFEHYEDIAGVEPITVTRGGRAAHEEVVGASITVRAVPGLTQEWLQRVVDCHLARNSALGHEVPEMPDCPLVPYGAAATVTSMGTGFNVAIRSDEAAAGQEIYARAQRLVKPGASR